MQDTSYMYSPELHVQYIHVHNIISMVHHNYYYYYYYYDYSSGSLVVYLNLLILMILIHWLPLKKLSMD